VSDVDSFLLQQILQVSCSGLCVCGGGGGGARIKEMSVGGGWEMGMDKTEEWGTTNWLNTFPWQ
jgi:hypothetical protein